MSTQLPGLGRCTLVSSDPIQDDTWHCGDGLCFHTKGLVLHLGWRDSWWGDLVSYDRD